jgi:hypothetical protein
MSNGEVTDVSKDLTVVVVKLLEFSKMSEHPDPEDGGTKPL